MSRTSIPVDSDTKDRLDGLKRDDETWDEFLLRVVTETGDGMAPGTLSDEEADEILEEIERKRSLSGVAAIAASVVGILFLNESLTARKVAGIGCAMLGIYLVSVE